MYHAHRISLTAVLTIFAATTLVTTASLSATDAAKSATVPEINKKIVEFCTAHMGQQVSNGECAMLVNEAFKDVGAKRKRDLSKPAGVTLRDDDYVWGRLLGADEAVLPGDIIQLRDIIIKTKTAKGTHTETMAHHTVVIKEVLGKNHFAVLHQNAGGVPPEKKRTVHPGEFNLNFKTQGEYWIYRPLAADAKK